MKSPAKKLVVVAHPDDETIFFGALILSEPQTHWTVLCVTNGDSKDRSFERAQELRAACQALGVRELLHWDFPDLFDRRLDVRDLSARLKALTGYNQIYTHGVLGEYGHPHHQDVSLAVHRAFPLLAPRSVAFNCAPEQIVNLDATQYALKMQIVSKIYEREFQRFVGLLPVSFSEGFVQLEGQEVETVYALLTGQRSVSAVEFAKACPHHAHLYELLNQGWVAHSARGFFASYFAPI